MSKPRLKDLRTRVDQELRGNILPFWMDHMVDREYGGFYGRVSNDCTVDPKAPKGLVLNARILWTYAAACRIYGQREYLFMADRAYDYFIRHFWDMEHQGAYWMLNHLGEPLEDKKQVYGEVFAIYALAEYFRVAQVKDSLKYAVILYETLEKFAYDPVHQGYLEGFTRSWQFADDFTISSVKSPEAKKTMNTHLHLMEAYTNLYRVYPEPSLRAKLSQVIRTVLDNIVDPKTHHFKLFLTQDWTSLSDEISFGHDIEGSWLLMEAAEVLGDPDLMERTEEIGLKMAQAVLKKGLDQDGGLFYEANPREVYNKGKFWWPQSETVVGFFNAYQRTLKKDFLDAAVKNWQFIEAWLIDKTHGEWFEYVKEGGLRPAPGQAKGDPWKCPYHNGRACMELYERIEPMLHQK